MSDLVLSPRIASVSQLLPEGAAVDLMALGLGNWQLDVRQRASDWLAASRGELEALRAKYGTDGWDGPDSLGVTRAATDNARRLLEWVYAELPYGIPPPEFAAEPDGEIAIDWARTDGCILSLSVGSHEKVNYAGIFPDGQTHHGNLPLGPQAELFQATVRELCRLVKKLYHYERP